MFLKSNKGFSLIEITVALGILSVTVLAFATMMTNQSRQTKALSEKMATLDLTNALIRTVANSAACDFMLTNPAVLTFDSTLIGSGTPPVINLNTVYPTASATGTPVAQVNTAASPLSASAVVTTIVINEITGADDSFGARLTVNFDETQLTHVLRPVSVGLSFLTDPASPANAKVITGCGSASAAIAGPPDLIWSGNLGPFGGRTYGVESLIAGKKFSDYKELVMIGFSAPVDNPVIGVLGRGHMVLPVSIFTAMSDRLFDVQTFSGNDSGTVGIRYITDTSFRWGIYRNARLNQIWGIP
jgi:prepilin-type N-terminal cleavage/methylation domain-containing protein